LVRGAPHACTATGSRFDDQLPGWTYLSRGSSIAAPGPAVPDLRVVAGAGGQRDPAGVVCSVAEIVAWSVMGEWDCEWDSPA
jgi:hypothetical protein